MINFFRINLPYGLERKNDGEWTVFNREYKPLGFNDRHFNLGDLNIPIFTSYIKLDEEFIFNLVGDEENSIIKNKHGEITKFFLYGDKTNPTEYKSQKLWDRYFDKLKILSQLKRK